MLQCGSIPLMTPLYVWHNTGSKRWTVSNGCSSNTASFQICLIYMCGVNMCCITQGASAGLPRMDAAIRQHSTNDLFTCVTWHREQALHSLEWMQQYGILPKCAPLHSNRCSNTAAFHLWLLYMCDITQRASTGHSQMDAVVIWHHSEYVCFICVA